MKKIATLLIIVLFCSCSSIKNNNYKIFKSYLMDKNRVKEFEEMCNSDKITIPDTIIINTLAISNRTIKRFFFEDKNDSKYTTSFWINCKENFVLSKSDLNYMEKQLSKFENNKEFNSKKLTFYNFKAFNSNSNDNTTKKAIVYSFSEPIMSLDNSYSIFNFTCYNNTLEHQYSLKSSYVIMKKINKQWVFVGELCENKTID